MNFCRQLSNQYILYTATFQYAVINIMCVYHCHFKILCDVCEYYLFMICEYINLTQSHIPRYLTYRIYNNSVVHLKHNVNIKYLNMELIILCSRQQNGFCYFDRVYFREMYDVFFKHQLQNFIPISQFYVGTQVHIIIL